MSSHDTIDSDVENSADTEAALQDHSHELVEEAPGEDVTDEMLLEDLERTDSWLHYNKGHEQGGYSPAERITTENVGSLELEYTIDEYDGFQNNPIVVPGDPPVLYYTRPNPQQVAAVNARTGDKYWSFTYENEDREGLTQANRGVSVRGDKVYLGAHDNNIVALDRYTGELQWTTKTLTDRQQEEMQVPERMANTQMPAVYNGKVFKGMTGYHGGFGSFSAVDAESGEIVWQLEMIPEEQWVGETWRFGDGSPWNNAAIDPESDTIFITTGNPGPMMNATVRPGPNKHTNSVLAVDTESGDVKWTTQLVPHDWHDYDTYNTRIVEVEVNGETQRVVEAVNKTGFLYFLEIETGRILERTEPYAKQGGEVPFMSVLPKGQENAKTVWPSDWGATEWPPDAFSKETGLVYVGANDTVKRYWYDDYEYNEEESEINIGGGLEQVDFEEFPDIQSHMVAMDPASGEEVWRYSYDRVESQARAAGVTATAGNVVFGGSPDGKLIAVDAESGDHLWEHNVSNLPRGITASPVTWDDESEGKQYVAIASLDGIQVFGLEAEIQDDDDGDDGSDDGGDDDGGDDGGSDGGSGDDGGSDGGDDGNETGDDGGDDSVPGFGAAAGAAGIGAGAAAAKRFGGDDNTDEEDEA